MKHTTKLAVLLALSVAAFGGTARAAEYTETIQGDAHLSTGDQILVDDEDAIDAPINSGTYEYVTGLYDGKEDMNVYVTGDVGITSESMEEGYNHRVMGIAVEGPGMNILSDGEEAKLNISVSGYQANGLRIAPDEADEIQFEPDMEIHVENHQGGKYSQAYGINVYNSNVNFGGDIDLEIHTDADTEFSAIRNSGDRIVFDGTVTAQITSSTNITDSENGLIGGIHGSYGSETIFNKEATIQIDAQLGYLPVAGVFSFYGNPYDGENIIQFNDRANIQVNNPSGMAVGVFVASDGVPYVGNTLPASVRFRNDVNIEANGADINSVAILAQTGGLVDIAKQDFSTEEGDAVSGRIQGNIQAGSGTGGDASRVNINLSGSDSFIHGDINIANDGAEAIVALHHGAVWETTGDMGGSLVSQLVMNGGVVRQEDTGILGIQNYSGSGDILFRANDTAPDGVLTFSTGDVVIGQAEAGSSVGVSVSNDTINTLDIAKTEENLNALAGKLMYEAKDDNLTGRVTLKEGLITPEASGDLNFSADGKGYVTNITGGNRVTETMDAMKHIAAIPILAWRQEDATLSQRLGDLRRSAGGQGIWARMSRGEFQYDGEYKNQYDFYQLGYDWASGPWHYGAAVSYNDGETSYRAGYGENSSTSLSLYGTWLGEKGHYADIVLKGGKLSNEYTITTAAGRTHGDYDLWGVSLSGEYGREIALADGWFVTPQAQMTLLHIGSEDYTTSNGIRVSQESLDSAVGRVGLEAGKRFGAGRVYGKFSLLHDFAGSADTWLRYEGLENSYREDIGDTWCEAGFGVNLRLTDSTYVYADVARTFGGDVETPWQWNAGVRWGF